MHKKTYRFVLSIPILLILIILGLSISTPNPVYAQGDIRPGFDDQSLADCDDCTSGLVQIGFPIDFFGSVYTELYVNSNGNVTFGAPLFSYTPFDLSSTGAVILAPFFADVDMSNITDPQTEEILEDGGVIAYGTGMVDDNRAFGVTWVDVKHFFSNNTTKRNTFQLVIIETGEPDSGDFRFEFNYGQIWWETGDGSGGQDGLGGDSARVGYSNGTRQFGTFFEVAGSGVPGSFLDTNPENGGLVGMTNGRLNFTVQSGAPSIVIANADSYSTAFNTPLESSTLEDPVKQSVLGNDVDSLNQPLTAALIRNTSNGSLILNTDGTFVYTPNIGFSGVDFFTYFANGSSVSNSATVTITVLASTNQAPIAENDRYRTDYETPITIPNGEDLLPTANDTDPEGVQNLGAVVVTQPQRGTLNWSNSNDGSFTYTPDAGYFGLDTFTYQAFDGETFSNVATITIRVLEPLLPPVAGIDIYSTAFETPLVVGANNSLLANDSDPNGDPITAILVSQPGNGVISNFSANGTFTYTPNAGFSGPDSFTYRISDGTFESSITTVSLVVSPTTNIPPVARSDNYTTAYETTLNVGAGNGVLANDDDPDTATLTTQLITNVVNGTLTFNNDGAFTYIPNAGYSGRDNFSYLAFDGIFRSNIVQVDIIVEEQVNTVPVAQSDSYNTAYETTLTVSAAEGVIANDDDPDAQPLTAELITNVLNGSLAFNSDGSFTYVPNAGYSGLDNFSYRIFDGIVRSNIVQVDIVIADQLNVAPVAEEDSYVTGYETILFINSINGVLANDTDSNGDTLRARRAQDTQNGTVNLEIDGSFSYSPNPGFIGTDQFTYYANDGILDSALTTVTVTVSEPDNAPPVAADDAYSTTYLQPLVVNAPGIFANDSDLNGDILTPIVVDRPLNGTLNMLQDGSFTYTPREAFNGLDFFTYRANDGMLASNLAVVRITVGNPENTAPVATGDTYTTAYETTLTINTEAGLLVNDSDANGDALTVQIGAPPTSGSLTPSADGSFTYTPDAGFSGLDIFTYQASDGVLTSNAVIVRINVREDDSPPLPPPTNLNVLGNLFITPINLAFTWAHPSEDAEDEGVPAELYEFTLARDGVILFSDFYDADQICDLQFCQINPQLGFEIVSGRYDWFVTAFSDVNGSATSEEAMFEVEILPPDVPTGISVDSSSARPVITWNQDPKAAWYQVRISDLDVPVGQEATANTETTYIIRTWFNRDEISCNEQTCSTIINNPIFNGLYQAELQAWGPGGYNASSAEVWSSGASFNVDFAPAPPPESLTVTSTEDGHPTFTWPAVTSASWYYLWVGTWNGGTNYQTASAKWYRAADANCTAELCVLDTTQRAINALSDGMWLSNGTYQTYMTAWGPGGTTGEYIQGTTFAINEPPAVAPQPMTPSGTIQTNRPVFSWDAVPGASAYQVYVQETSTSVQPFLYNEWHLAAELGCGAEGTVCSLQNEDLWIRPGNYRWFVRSYGPAGSAVWSAQQTFIRIP